MGSPKRFGYEWSKYSGIIPEYEIQFLRWVYPLKKEDFRGKEVLDAGCGTGRNSYWPLVYGAKRVVAFDYDERTVEVARRNLSQFKNAEVLLKSIYEIDFENEFDIVFSIGVIHHLENPNLAIKNLVRAAKKGGIVLIWVYAYEGNEWIVKYINPIRKYVTSKIPPRILDLLSYFFSVPLFLFLKTYPNLKHPYLKMISNFRFWHVHSIVFDQLLPEIANYWKKEEVLSLLEGKGLKDIKIFHTNSNSWTALGIKE